MIKLFSLKKEQEAAAASSASSEKKVAPGLIRMQKDVSELKTNEKGIKVVFPDPDDIMAFQIEISPFDGLYKDGTFVFDCKVPKSYPHEPPKVICQTQVYHPNIDMEGHVCLNILREDWKPVLTINSIIMGLQFLMLEPNADDPLNKTAANEMVRDERRFQANVDMTMRGKSILVDGKRYDFPKFR